MILGWEDALEEGEATHSSILAWRIPWTVQSMGSQRVDTTERLSLKCFEFFLVGGIGVHARQVGCWGQPTLRVSALSLDALTQFK